MILTFNFIVHVYPILLQKKNNMELHKCSVCLERIGNRTTYITCCNHVFHDSCIQTWKTFQSRAKRTCTCPLCRKRLARQPVNIAYSTIFREYAKVLLDYYKIHYRIVNTVLAVLCCILYSVQVREEIHDYGMCQWDASIWCQSKGYTWFKSEKSPLFLCNIDYCYRNTYFGF